MFQFAMLNKQMVYDSYWKFMEQIIGKSWEDSKILEDRGFIRKNPKLDHVSIETY